jgi:hypothetical protein
MARGPTIYALGDEALTNLVEKMGGGSGDGGYGGLEARIAKVESSIEHIQRDLADIKTDVRELRKDANRDFRILFGAIIFVALGTAGLMARGFHWL